MFLLTHASEDKDIPLRSDSDHKRDQWLKLITKASLACVTTKKKMEREKKEMSKQGVMVANSYVTPPPLRVTHDEGQRWFPESDSGRG